MQSNCTPGTATPDTDCDSVDDDCDGTADDDYASVPTTCGTGACGATGTSSCVGGVVQSNCTPGTATPDTDCDSVDDDCDGTADDDYASVPTTCGTGACGATGTSSCVGGVVQSNCTPGTATPDTDCDSVDDDCDGTADDDYASMPTTCGTGACGATGTSSCVGGVVQSNCTPGTATPDTDCDSVDDDCDGTADDNYPTTPTTCGVGACASTGTLACVTGSPVDSCVAGTGSSETCNGIDDNCNGSIDENGALICSDGSACTADVCNGAAGCSNAPITCDDGNVCNGLRPARRPPGAWPGRRWPATTTTVATGWRPASGNRLSARYSIHGLRAAQHP